METLSAQGDAPSGSVISSVMTPSEAITYQVVFLPLGIIWIKGLIFFHHSPRDMKQFPGRGTTGHFLGLTRLP